MSLQTEAMREDADKIISAVQHENGKWSGIELVNHPTPSGCQRWLPSYSDKREWDDPETAKSEFEKILPK